MWRLVVACVALTIAIALGIHGTSTPRSYNAVNISMSTSTFSLRISAFENGGTIPSQYTCDGLGINPAVDIVGVPAGTMSLALIMDDPDVPKQLKPDGVFDHWVRFNIPPETTSIPAGDDPDRIIAKGSNGLNGRGETSYTGPCPPPQYEPNEHRYIFKLYALDRIIHFEQSPTKAELEGAMRGHIIAEAQYVGRYKRK